MRRYLVPSLAVFVLLLVSVWHDDTPFLSHRITLAPGFTESLIAGDLDKPTHMAFAPDGRLFVAEQTGAVRIIKNGALIPEPFIRLNVATDFESGLLEVAFDPHFAENQWVYLYLTTATSPSVDRLVRVTAHGDVAEPGSETTLFETAAFPPATTHRGGAIAFDADDFMYLTVGDANVPENAQALNTLFGKVLRLTRDGKPAPGNPFAGKPGARPEIFAYGLRNTFTITRNAETGVLYLNDVGENDSEEVDVLERGANYGWGLCEGKCAPKRDGFTDPVFEYAHKTAEMTGCALTAAVVYNPAQVTFPASYLNQYFYADLCGGWIRVVRLATGDSEPFAKGLTYPVDLETGPDGALYYLSRGGGKNIYRSSLPGQVWRIQYHSQ